MNLYNVLKFSLIVSFVVSNGDRGAVAGNWQTPGEINAPTGKWQTPGEIKAPTGKWLVPGAVQAPKGEIQKPGQIQIPKDFKAPVVVEKSDCQHRLAMGSDVLFDFNKAEINSNALVSLTNLGEMVKKEGKHPIRVEGHTDSIGSDDYNQRLSELRATSVKDWLIDHQYMDYSATSVGFGRKKPIAANKLPNGKDNPAGRQKNRRVEIVIDTCK